MSDVIPSKLRRHDPDDHLFIIGLVGRAGSGKTTAARAIADGGGVVIEADALGHQVTATDPVVREGLIAEYGPEVYREDGTLDRKRVAAKVFTDPLARGRLDRLVHPKIMEHIMRRLEELRQEQFNGVVVIDAALMLDWQLERWCDVVIAVVAPEAQQLARLVAGRGWSEDEAARRLKVQRTNEAFAETADLTLVNDGSADDLVRRMREGVAELAAAHANRVPLSWK